MLFSYADIKSAAQLAPNEPAKDAQALHFDTEAQFIAGNELTTIQKTIGNLVPGKAVWFKTDGAWSTINLLEYILNITGPAAVSFTTWAINEVAITRFIAWKQSGLITDLEAVIDVGLRNRKPAIYQQAAQAFPKLKLAHCHAKATVVINGCHHITFIGSSNYTTNPRKEVGVIIWDETIALENRRWIGEEVHGI